jgi:hypothetical protein
MITLSLLNINKNNNGFCLGQTQKCDSKKIDKLDQYHVIVKILFVKPKYL